MIFLLAALLWGKNWNAAFSQAKQQHKLVLVDYGQAPCPQCFEIEHLIRNEPALGKALVDFVLLRVDFEGNDVPGQFRYESPAYVIFDADGRERLRIDNDHGFRAHDWHAEESHRSIELRDPHAERKIIVDVGGVIQPIARFGAAAPAFVQAAELFDAKRDLDAHFLVASTYARLRMTEHARAAYAEAKKVAEARGNPAAAQIAEVQSALTYVSEQRAAHAVELLKPLTKTPADRNLEALIWLSLGQAFLAETDREEAIGAYKRAEAFAPEGSRTRAEASAALKRLP